MLNYPYYPFDKKLEEINSEELLKLKEVSEGWYVDYKREHLKKPLEYAKHLSAFANQYGGWLFIGITESNDHSRKAGEFNGVDKSRIPEISLAIREASSAHISPEVLYEERTIEGPCDKISLGKDKAILIIGIPRSINAPHIHSSGRIYRRLADQSKPKEETDRFILDDMWKRGEENRKKISEFLTRLPRLPIKQAESPWAHVYFKPREGQPVANKKLSFNAFVDIINSKNSTFKSVSTPMEAIQSTANGYFTRQTYNNDPSLAALSFQWWHNGCARIDIPLNKYDIESFLQTHAKNNFAHQYCNLANDAGYTEMSIVDYSMFTQVLAAMSIYYLNILKETEDDRDIKSCFSLRNLFYTSPFIDSSKFIERTRKFSLPITFESEIKFPEDPSDINMINHPFKDRNFCDPTQEKHHALPYLFSLPVIYQVLHAVGIAPDEDTFIEDHELFGFEKIRQK